MKTSIFFGIWWAAFKNEKPSYAMTSSHQAWVKNIKSADSISSNYQETYGYVCKQFACFMWPWKIC